ncbi:PIR Superfamily Protein [Plasmodium ovale wallikeri]|uniref:PIR Superfamily Protein n=1 Tax=Plasmodium ovale wallikeri TaxID=864142 RepID=A0A1A9ANT4_PLAOA|nr:PIR Superfamily Protein [Plasmodium ovale wallikeri]SBT57753.1 PIR Superfamily Protein [Plasmodium ovale wallikeri]
MYKRTLYNCQDLYADILKKVKERIDAFEEGSDGDLSNNCEQLDEFTINQMNYYKELYEHDYLNHHKDINKSVLQIFEISSEYKKCHSKITPSEEDTKILSLYAFDNRHSTTNETNAHSVNPDSQNTFIMNYDSRIEFKKYLLDKSDIYDNTPNNYQHDCP